MADDSARHREALAKELVRDVPTAEKRRWQERNILPTLMRPAYTAPPGVIRSEAVLGRPPAFSRGERSDLERRLSRVLFCRSELRSADCRLWIDAGRAWLQPCHNQPLKTSALAPEGRCWPTGITTSGLRVFLILWAKPRVAPVGMGGVILSIGALQAERRISRRPPPFCLGSVFAVSGNSMSTYDECHTIA